MIQNLKQFGNDRILGVGIFSQVEIVCSTHHILSEKSPKPYINEH